MPVIKKAEYSLLLLLLILIFISSCKMCDKWSKVRGWQRQQTHSFLNDNLIAELQQLELSQFIVVLRAIISNKASYFI